MNASRLVRRLFDLPVRRRVLPPVPADVIDRAMPAAGQLTLLGGGSGGGKSRLLRALQARPGTRWVEPANLPLGDACVVDCLCDALAGHAADDDSRVELALELLSRVGLAEAWTYLQTPAELSDGQRWRLRLAMAVAYASRPADDATTGDVVVSTSHNVTTAGTAAGSPDCVLAIDEFAALLDRVTARVVARALRRLIDRPGGPRLAAVVATSHDDLVAALSPDIQVVADFGVYRVRTF